MSALQTLLTDPDAFFAARSDDPSYKGPLLVVLAVSLVSAVAVIPQVQTIFSAFDFGEITGTVMTVVNVMTFAVAIVVPFVVWVLWAGAIHVISVVFEGDGEFSTLLALVGWAFVPRVFNAAATGVINYYRFQVRGVDVPDTINQETMRQFVQNLSEGPLVAATAVLGVAFTLWSAYLMFHAARHARDLDRRGAAIAVAVPLVISLLLSARTILTAMG